MKRELKALWILRGIKQADIASRLSVSRAAISIVVSGKGRSRRIQAAIAAELGKNVSALWPNKHKAA